MPKIIQLSEFDELLGVIGRSPGMSLDELMAKVGADVSRRTLQRRLAVLLDQGRVSTRRDHRVVRYGLAVPPEPAPLSVRESEAPWLAGSKAGETYVITSPEGEAIKAHVRQPVQARRPVGYAFDFLQAYRPNETWYLPAALREQLHVLGRSPEANAPAGTFAQDILDRLLIDLSWASSRLEGNTYSRLDTERLIRQGEVAEGKDAVETQMILNHKAAIEFVVHDAASVGVDAPTVIALHALLSDGLLTDPMACGRLRRRVVDIGGSVYRPMAMPQRLEEVFHIVLDMAAEIADPFEQAFFLTVHLPYLQPFEDVNKRVSRLAANIPLIKANLSPLSFIDVPERAYVDGLLGVYELNRVDLLRDVFVWAYERSCQQYLAVRAQMVPPDLLRLRHRGALAEVIRAIVRMDLSPDEATLREHLPLSVPLADADAFVRLVRTEFTSLHAGNAVRFGLRPLELDGWRQRHPPQPPS